MCLQARTPKQLALTCTFQGEPSASLEETLVYHWSPRTRWLQNGERPALPAERRALPVAPSQVVGRKRVAGRRNQMPPQRQIGWPGRKGRLQNGAKHLLPDQRRAPPLMPSRVRGRKRVAGRRNQMPPQRQIGKKGRFHASCLCSKYNRSRHAFPATLLQPTALDYAEKMQQQLQAQLCCLP
jgi:hypothetical protein